MGQENSNTYYLLGVPFAYLAMIRPAMNFAVLNAHSRALYLSHAKRLAALELVGVN
jgi:hypothetical protein